MVGPMKKRVFVTKWLCLLMLLVVTAAGLTVYWTTGSNYSGEATSTNFTQADLTGTWHVYALEGGSVTGWARSVITVASNGSVTFYSYIDSSGANSTAAAVLTIDQATGVVTDSSKPDDHLTMAWNKKFIAGTIYAPGTSHPGIIVFQKEVPGTSYADSDLQNKHFVYHELKVCGAKTDNRACEYGWEYGAGTISGNSKVIRTSKIKPSGTYVSKEDLGSISVDSDGIVRTSEGAVFDGFLSCDKKTIVGTMSDNKSGRHVMMIIQMTDNQFASTGNMAGTWYNHLLAVGYENFWAHQSIGINSKGEMTFGNLSVSNGNIIAPTDPETIAVASSGAATMAPSSDFHGQVSYDGTFMAGTRTVYTTPVIYSLMIITRRPPNSHK